MAGSMVQFAAAPQPRGRILRYLAPAALAILLAAIVVVTVSSIGRSGRGSTPARAPRAAVHNVPPYWVVRAGDTYAQISEKTGLTIGQLEAFNPQANPQALQPGQRLNLWQHPPAPRPKPPGPMFWTVRSGDSLGLIADKTGIDLATIEQLNPRLASATLQPGERVRLRR
ncbi:MAG: LysM peptidoglycan-binding domain-containing protein [Solirubrobacterales bacterium]|nr:LysM peptidoglycan-binding domain-containing protein [Solirubrobacterales bacterium]